ncbi:hypothetical protein EXIGLDRAFT_691011 [Exidia glandulosa HHB12029]|uniref:F-box domain-containing protein n=1 Tax=Exidia glandulosa HHB12029 TaxID=1314781 RepID=A0A165P8B3_EXIGL|nr:hypothetical protein EXIGLDRAFT_691011 [Exidia glandulosa HHB12029]
MCATATAESQDTTSPDASTLENFQIWATCNGGATILGHFIYRDTERFVDAPVVASAYVRPENERAEPVGIQNRLQQAELAHGDTTFRTRDAEGSQDASSQQEVLLYAQPARRVLSRGVGAMPLEILGDIFEFCRPYMPASVELRGRPEDILARQHQPFRLASVCWQWRAAAFACAAVWGHMELSLDNVTGETSSIWAAFLETCSERSKQTPLTIRLSRHRGSEPYDHQLLAILISHMPRCIAFHLDVHRILSDDSLSQLLSVRADNLESARLDMNVPAGWNGQPFAHSPLGELYIAHPGGMSLEPHNCSCNIVLQHLDITPGNVDATQFFDEVLRCGDDLGITLEYPLVRPGPVPLTRITCAGVEELHFELDDDAALERVAHQLDLPNLQDLSLNGYDESSNSRLAFLTGLGPLPKLVSLTVSGLSPKDFSRLATKVLFGFETLQYLSVDRTDIKRGVLSRLCTTLGARQGSDSLWMCPNLVCVRFGRECEFDGNCDEGTVIQLVEQRSKKGLKICMKYMGLSLTLGEKCRLDCEAKFVTYQSSSLLPVYSESDFMPYTLK